MTAHAAPGPTTPVAEPVLERLWPSAGVWLATVMVSGFCAVVVLPFGERPALVTLAATALALGALLARSTPVVGVRDGQFVAGRAHVPVALLGDTVALDAAAMRHACGPGLDARAHLCVRGWVRGGLRVDLVDPQDPTPYWLISSRHPERLLGAVRAARDPRLPG